MREQMRSDEISSLILIAEPKEASGDSDRLATGLQRREFNGQQERNTIKPNGQKGIEDAAVPKCQLSYWMFLSGQSGTYKRKAAATQPAALLSSFVKTALTYYVETSPDWDTKMKYYGGMPRLTLPQELGGAYVYLLSKTATYTTGIDIPIAGIVGAW